MKQLLFVTNGHGETAIAARIAVELRAILPDGGVDHLALVGNQKAAIMVEVGPRRPMPSGGLIAMGNTRNLAQDLRAGLLGLTLAQVKFLLQANRRYDAAVAVGDAYALAMAFIARRPTIFVGSAKSVDVAPYGAFERRLLSRTAECFVRDEATAAALRAHGLRAQAANAIVDLATVDGNGRIAPAIAEFTPVVGLFPGSRASAYEDATFLLDVVCELARRRPKLGGLLSIAAGLDPTRFASEARRAGWEVNEMEDEMVPFVLRRGARAIVRAWRGELGMLLARSVLVLGQAGTANEAAAAAGVPVVAFERDCDHRSRWYRERQRGLLGEALAVFPAERNAAVAGVSAILDDPERLARMSQTGRARMGRAGAAKRIAERIAQLLRG